MDNRFIDDLAREAASRMDANQRAGDWKAMHELILQAKQNYRNTIIYKSFETCLLAVLTWTFIIFAPIPTNNNSAAEFPSLTNFGQVLTQLPTSAYTTNNDITPLASQPAIKNVSAEQVVSKKEVQLTILNEENPIIASSIVNLPAAQTTTQMEPDSDGRSIIIQQDISEIFAEGDEHVLELNSPTHFLLVPPRNLVENTNLITPLLAKSNNESSRVKLGSIFTANVYLDNFKENFADNFGTTTGPLLNFRLNKIIALQTGLLVNNYTIEVNSELKLKSTLPIGNTNITSIDPYLPGAITQISYSNFSIPLEVQLGIFEKSKFKLYSTTGFALHLPLVTSILYANGDVANYAEQTSYFSSALLESEGASSKALQYSSSDTYDAVAKRHWSLSMGIGIESKLSSKVSFYLKPEYRITLSELGPDAIKVQNVGLGTGIFVGL